MEFSNEKPIYLQIMHYLKKEIVSGQLRPGDKLLSTREMALQINVNPNTIQRVYKELEVQETVFTKRGLGTFVSEDQAIVQKLRDEIASDMIEELVAEMTQIGIDYKTLSEMIKKVYEK